MFFIYKFFFSHFHSSLWYLCVHIHVMLAVRCR
jgi:hypothetical protein